MTEDLKILLIEDNEGDIRILKELLKEQIQLNFDLRHADSVRKAAELLENDSFDVILLDLGLPDSNGFETFIKINTLTQSLIATIILTGLNDTELSMRAVNQGAQDYLIKGQIDSEKLVKSIVYSYERKRLTIELESQLEAKRIKESELVSLVEQLNLIAESTNAAMYQMNINESKFVYAHTAIETLTGYNITELNDMGFTSIIRKVERVGGKPLDIKLLPAFFERKNLTEYCIDYLIELKNGELNWVNDKSLPWLNERGEVLGSIGVLMDVSLKKEAEADYYSQKNKSDQLFTNSPVAIAQLDKDGCILNVNNSFVSTFGYTRTQAIGDNINELLVPKDSEAEALDFMDISIEGLHIYNDSIRKKSDGSLIHVSLAGVPIRRGNKIIGFYAMYTDITKQKLAEEAILNERRLMRTLIDNLPDPIYIMDKKGRKVIANIADVKNIGLNSEDEIIGKTDIELFPGKTGQRGHADNMKIISSGKAIIGREEDFVDINGDRSWLETTKIPLKDVNGKITGLVGVGHNITERKKAEEELRHSYGFNESLLKTIPFAMDIVDETGTVLYQNDIFSLLFGAEGIGKKCWELYRDDKTQCSECPLKNGITVNETDVYESYGILNNRIFEISHTGMMYKGKKAMLEIFQDISDRKHSEEELIHAKDKAEESDRLKTAFLHNISHEIRTPMNAIVGFSALLSDPGTDVQSQKEYIEVINQSSAHLLAIITDIIDISNIEANIVRISKNNINVNSALNSICEQFIPEVGKKNIQLIFDTSVPDAEALIITDSTKLTQILTNLISNALKFTHEGYVKVNCKQIDKFLEFRVTDTGIGISEEYFEKIFDRFYQVQHGVSRLFEGTGLGLSISKAYVELLGGKIWLSSEPGKGTSFHFRIPHEKQAVGHLSEVVKKDTNDQLSKKKKTILVAEDIDSNYMLIKYILSTIGIEPLRAVNGQEAVSMYKENNYIDLILMDIKMPVMDGYTATKLIREMDQRIPIIAQTAFTDDRVKAEESGCNAFISKPYNKLELIEMIKEHIAEKR